MANLPVIRNIDELLKNNLGPHENIVKYKLSRFTAPGENFGSLMLRMVVEIKNKKSGEMRNLDTVAKLIPETEEYQKIFDIQSTCKSEYNFYATIVPILDKLLKNYGFKNGADFLAPFYGGRINLLNEIGSKVDNDAVIVLKNLKPDGYVVGEKSVGLDIDTAKLILETLAKFHASSIALRLQQPEVFEKYLRPNCWTFSADYLKEMAIKGLMGVLRKNDFTQDQINTVKKIWKYDPRKTDVSLLWGTMIHSDAWTNNILLKYEDAKPVNCILVDFQVFDYGTPLNDVIFFIFTSVEKNNLENRTQFLLDYYYNAIIRYLAKFSVNIEDFSKSSFEDEIKTAVQRYEYVHSLWMLLPLMNKKFVSLDQINNNTIDLLLDWSEEHINKIKLITKICFEKEWL